MLNVNAHGKQKANRKVRPESLYEGFPA